MTETSADLESAKPNLSETVVRTSLIVMTWLRSVYSGEPPLQTPPPVPLTLTPTLNYIFFLGRGRNPLPQGVVFDAITATNPYYLVDEFQL